MVPSVFGLIALSKPVISIIFGEEYSRTALLLSFLSIYLIPRTIGVVGSSYLIGAGKAGIVAKLTIITAVLNFGLNLFFIPLYGALGAVITTLVTHSAYIFVAVYLAKKTYQIQFLSDLWINILKFIFASIVMYFGVISIRYLSTNLKGLLITMVLGAVIYMLILISIKGITKKDLQKLKIVFSRGII